MFNNLGATSMDKIGEVRLSDEVGEAPYIKNTMQIKNFASRLPSNHFKDIPLSFMHTLSVLTVFLELWYKKILANILHE